MSYQWEAILVGVGLQQKSLTETRKEMKDKDNSELSEDTVRSLFHKLMARFYKMVSQIY